MWIICVAAVVFYHQILSFLRAEKNALFLYMTTLSAYLERCLNIC